MRSMMKRQSSASIKQGLLISALALVACSSSTDLPDERPLIDGTITAFHAARVLIEADISKCERFWLAIDGETRMLALRRDGSTRSATTQEIVIGQRARAWTDDPVAESCPAQGHADVILLHP